MVKIESAYFGDEKGYRNITSYLLSKISGGTIDVTANENLIPVFEISEKTELDSQDEKAIRADAIKQCGEANQTCLEATRARLRAARLKEKETEQGMKNVIKGRRLTVNVVDDNGKRKQLVAPDGQNFKLDGIKGGIVASDGLPKLSAVQEGAWSLLGIIFIAFVYVFGIAMSYTLFMRESEIATTKPSIIFFQSLAWASGILSILLAIFTSPTWGWMVGYMTVAFYFGGKTFLDEYVAKSKVEV